MIYLKFKSINQDTKTGVFYFKYKTEKSTLFKFGNTVKYLIMACPQII